MVAEALSDTKRPSKLKQPRHALTSDFDRLTAGLPEGRPVNAESLSDSTSEGIDGTRGRECSSSIGRSRETGERNRPE
jgi:hypothetical protein